MHAGALNPSFLQQHHPHGPLSLMHAGALNPSFQTHAPVRTCRTGDALAQLHSECLSRERAVVVRWAGGASADAGRLLLVPLRALEGTPLNEGHQSAQVKATEERLPQLGGNSSAGDYAAGRFEIGAGESPCTRCHQCYQHYPTVKPFNVSRNNGYCKWPDAAGFTFLQN